MPAQEIKLPLLCQVIHLNALPQQPEGSRYIVAWGGGIREPEGGLGYVFDMSGKRTGRPIAWLQDGGFVHAVDGIISQVPDAEPAIGFARWRNKADSGRITVRLSDENVRQAAEYHQHGSAGYSFVEPICDLGRAYTAARVPFRELLAISFLAFFYLPTLAGSTDTLGRTMDDALTVFTQLPPADAVDALIAEVVSGARTSGFERYAALILADADPAAFRAVAARNEVSLRRLGSTGLFWLACDLSALNGEEFDTLMGMEAALNRLALMARRARENDSNALGASTMAYCADEDWRTLRSITDQTAPLLKGAAYGENSLRTLYGAAGARGGEWDLRTRFAGILERLALPYRLAYRFAVNAAAGEITVAAKVPAAQTMPRWVRGAAGAGAQVVAAGSAAAGAGAAAAGESTPHDALAKLAAAEGLAPCGDHAEVAANAYALRLVAALAAAGFGSGAGVARVRVRLCTDRAFKQPVLAAEIDRTAYIMSIYDAVRKGTFSEPRLTWGVTGLAELLQPGKLFYRLGERLGLEPIDGVGELTNPAPSAVPGETSLELLALVQPSFDPDPARTQSLWLDERRLTPELAELLHADEVRELDVYHLGEDPYKERLAEAIKLSETQPREAAQQLADLLEVMNLVDEVSGECPAVEVEAAAEGEVATEPAPAAEPGADAATGVSDASAAAPDPAVATTGEPAAAGTPAAPAAPRRLYCSSGMARLAMSLDDPNPQARYRYVNDTRYDTLLALARLCIDNHDADHGLAYAEQAIELGPTSPGAYIVAATACADLGNPERAAGLLKDALRYDLEPLSYTYTYYRLAFVLWRAGDPRVGLVCYERALANPRLRQVAKQEMDELMAEAHIEHPFDADDAVAALAATDIPIAPTDEMLGLVARAMIAAADAGFINLAYAYSRTLLDTVQSDVFSSAAASLAPWAE